MRIGRRSWHLGRAVALAAMLVQAAIPLLIAAEIVIASNAVPICSAATAGDHDNTSPHTPGHACPICAAMAASAAVTATTPPALPLPRTVITRTVTAPTQDAPAFVFAAAYRSRAPPVA